MKASESGFSLMEVLVALAVFSTAGLGLMTTVTQTARNANFAQVRALAVIVAENHMADVTSQQTITAREETTQTVQLGRTFWIDSTIAPTEVNQLYTLEVTVRASKEGQILATRSALVSALEFAS